MRAVVGRVLALVGATVVVFFVVLEIARWNHVVAYVVAGAIALLTGAYLIGSTQKSEAP